MSDLVKVGSFLRLQPTNFMKNSRSSLVYLLPLPCGIMLVGGLGDRDGGSGIFMSALGAGRRFPKIGDGAVRLLMVLLRVAWESLISGGVAVEWLDLFCGRLFDEVEADGRDLDV